MKGGTSDISLIASSILELPILLHDCRSIVVMIVWTCAYHYFVFVGATDPEPKNQKYTNDPSGGSRILVAGILILSTLGEAIIR